MAKIVRMLNGFTNVALIVNGSQSVLIDTGKKGIVEKLPEKLDQNHLTLTDLKLIILTHTHYDHTGELNELVKLTGAKVAVNIHEKEDLEKGFSRVPSGTNPFTKILTNIASYFIPKYASPKPFKADIIVEKELSLKPWGIDGIIIHTPGHSDGSQSVLISDKLFAGDSFFNVFPTTVFPPFANDPKQLLRTWEKIFDLKVKVTYPSHGAPFKIEKAYKSYEKWKRKI